MTMITFFNRHNPDEIWTKEALDSNIGKELPLTNTVTGETGVARIVAVGVDDEGITVTYETDMILGLRMDHFVVEPADLEMVTPFELETDDGIDCPNCSPYDRNDCEHPEGH